jgi:hypothetical protein
LSQQSPPSRSRLRGSLKSCPFLAREIEYLSQSARCFALGLSQSSLEVLDGALANSGTLGQGGLRQAGCKPLLPQ